MARDVAMMKSILLKVMVYSADCKLLEAAKEGTARYHDYAKSLSATDKANNPPPHVFAWNAMMTFIRTEASDNQEVTTALQLHVADLTELVPDNVSSDKNKTQMLRMHQLSSMVKYFRVSQCFGKKTCRVECHIVDDTTAKAVMAALFKVLKTTSGGVEKLSQAPRGKLERQIREIVGSGPTDE